MHEFYIRRLYIRPGPYFMASVKISNLEKRYGKVEVLHQLDLNVADGRFIVLLGPSGCGKSTLPVSYTHLTLPTNREV